jgi:hypothetical protein
VYWVPADVTKPQLGFILKGGESFGVHPTGLSVREVVPPPPPPPPVVKVREEVVIPPGLLESIEGLNSASLAKLAGEINSLRVRKEKSDGKIRND